MKLKLSQLYGSKDLPLHWKAMRREKETQLRKFKGECRIRKKSYKRNLNTVGLYLTN